VETRFRLWNLLAALTLLLGMVPSTYLEQTASVVAAPLEDVSPISDRLYLRLAVGTFDPLVSTNLPASNAALHLAQYPGKGVGYYIVQLAGPVTLSDVDALETAGLELFDYLPDFAFIVKMDAAQQAVVEALPAVRWSGIYQPAYRISPVVMARASQPNVELELVVSAFRGASLSPIVAQITELGGKIVEQSETAWQGKLRVSLPATAVADVANVNGVRWVEPAPNWKLHNELSDNIMGVRDVWTTDGLYGAGQTVAVCDTGLDQGSTAPASLHDDFENGSGGSRVTTVLDRVGDGGSDVNSGHGTHVAGSVLGNGDLSGATPSSHTYPESAYAGMAPEASLVFQAVETNATEGLDGIPFDLNVLFAQAVTHGADLHTNSWGSDASGGYTTDSEAVDQFIWNNKNYAILFSAGNAGVDGNSDGTVDLDSMGAPGTAKNCITVGASENNRPSLSNTWYQGWPADFPTNPVRDDKMADNTNGLAAFSSRGPTDDSRYKPDIVAPGSFIISTRSSMATGNGWGTVDANYMYMGGTSMATPLTAGALAVIRQFFTDKQGLTPSAALLKATLVNGATEMHPGQYGTGATQEIPSTRPTNVAGWGRVNVQNSVLPTGSRVMTYTDNTTGLTTGNAHTYNYHVVDGSEALNVTLAWTDYPGSVAAHGALVNDLDLTLTAPNGTTHYPNNAGAQADRTNNLVGIDIAAPATGWYTLTVTGYNIPHGPQPYALVIAGGLGAGDTNTAPVLNTLPNQSLNSGQTLDNAIDLWAYASDSEDADAALTFSIINTPPAGLNITVDRDRYIDIAPQASYSGSSAITVRVTDSGGKTAQQSFNVTVNAPPAWQPIPAQWVPLAGYAHIVDLWAYASDSVDAHPALTFMIGAQTPISAGLSIESNRYVNTTPHAGFAGMVDVLVQVQDTGGLTATTSFQVIVTSNNITPTLTLTQTQWKANNTQTLDLRTYAADRNDGADGLTYTVQNVSTSSLTATINNTYQLNLTPAPDPHKPH